MLLGGAQRLPLGSPADRPGDVKPGCLRGAPGEDEAPELRQLGVELVAVGLESVDLRLRDAETAVALERHRQVGTDVEQLVLHALEHCADPVGRIPGEHDAERGVQLVDRAVCGEPEIELRDARPVPERRLPRVAPTGVDLREADRLVSRARHAAKANQGASRRRPR